jgi:hypothetical protein
MGLWWESKKEIDHQEDPDLDGKKKFWEELIVYFP